MYERYFNLDSKPFTLTPDPRYLYFSSQHRIAYSMLEYGLLEQAGITVITGDVGAGKTTLLRHALNQYADSEITVGLITNTHEGTADELMKYVALAFDIDHAQDKVSLLKQFQKYLIEQYARGKITVLIVDEAQNLGEKGLEEIRLLNNINANEDELLKIVLIGQPELLDRLTKPELSQLAQRVSVEFHLQALSLADTVEYVRHRLQVAGADHEIFDEAAIYAIYAVTGGVPRLINTICDFALMYAFATESQNIDLQGVLAAIRGRRVGGINRMSRQTDDMRRAIDFVKTSTGVDLIEELQLDDGSADSEPAKPRLASGDHQSN